jgi:hypothetical protein
MPYLVAYVVADVVLIWVLMSAFVGCIHTALHASVAVGQIRTYAAQQTAPFSITNQRQAST